MVDNYQAVPEVTLMNTAKRYSTLYKVSCRLSVLDGSVRKGVQVSNSDIVSISIMHEYDTNTFPIIRLRLYTDLTTMELLNQAPDTINVDMALNGNIYEMADEDMKQSVAVGPATNMTISMDGYIEYKNTPTSVFDQYDQGIKKASDLNVEKKVPIDVYCYNKQAVQLFQTKAPGIFKNMTIHDIIKYLIGNLKLDIDPVVNNIEYSQVLLPNLSVSESLSFFDRVYGMYPKGAQVYSDIDKIYVANTDCQNSTTPLAIHVDSYKNNDDNGGMRKVGSQYQMSTKAQNVSVVSETDLERVLNSYFITSTNVNTKESQTTPLIDLYSELSDYKALRLSVAQIKQDKRFNSMLDSVSTPNILHKSYNDYLSEMYAARVYERITRMDISGVGFDIGKMNIRTRYNVCFDSPIRGFKTNKFYRAAKIVHVLTNLSSNLFVAQTTMTICTN